MVMKKTMILAALGRVCTFFIEIISTEYQKIVLKNLYLKCMEMLLSHMYKSVAMIAYGVSLSFEILSLSGPFMPTNNKEQRSWSGCLSVSLASPNGRVRGGGIAGLLIATCPMQLMLSRTIGMPI
ncbi:uncharacterized protein LOC129305760 isoform X2 [Prosopis cineraria]|uniref:uncharacterized protein LOC129305760 isoform X2 n=1 Tax=Prosopis cineraria TaxID=364024 RepID=UPI00241085BA|nr:uncharacterized protein LOC129305760 isoform X2 [Prosopis cineraria]